MVKPDYSEYSYSELLDVLKHIDREKYPERYEEVSKAFEAAGTYTRFKENGHQPKRLQWFSNRLGGIFLAIYSVYVAVMIIYTGYPGFKSYRYEWSLFFIDSEPARLLISTFVLLIGFGLAYVLWSKKKN